MRAGTIVASNYVEMARLLADSFLDHHPTDTFVILVVDDLPLADVIDDESRRFEIVRLADLGLSERHLDMMKTIYDVMELSTAVKPSFLELLLRDDPVACYLDPDIYVYAPFGELIVDAATSDDGRGDGYHDPPGGIVLTPHVVHPIPRDGLAPTERMIMQSGIFNLGFIAVGRRAASFLEWWQERLLVDSVSDVEANLFTDQRWVDWVPALFGCAVCRDPGMNIAWWNIHERPLHCASADASPNEMTGGAVTVDGAPLRFVHFSGFDPIVPDRFSKHQERPRTAHEAGSVIRQLADRYGAALQRNGHDERRATPYQWNTTEQGAAMTSLVRWVCRRALLNGERTGTEAGEWDDSVPTAFGPSADRFEAWLTDDVAGSDAVRFTRIEAGLWESRADLRAAFPYRDGVDAERFRNWLDHDPSVPSTLGTRWSPPDEDADTAEASVDVAPVPAPTGRRQLVGRVARRGVREGHRAARFGRRKVSETMARR